MKTITPPNATPDAWNPDALFNKALRYAEQMHEKDPNSWEQLLWSSLSLELLLRAALSNVSPALIAETSNKDWSHLYVALGFNPLEEKYSPRTIATNEVISRLSKIFPEFNKEVESFCTIHTGRRNAELHSGDNPFEGLAEASWLPRFYKASEILLSTMGLEMKEFFDEEVVSTANKLMEAAADEKAQAAKGDVAAHQKVWEAKSAEEQETARESAKVWAMKNDGHRTPCPACDSTGLLFGEAVSAPQRTLEGDEIQESHENLPTNFECVACGLKITGLSKLSAVGLGDRFKRTYTYDAAEFYAPEDAFHDYEDDNNEPF